MEVLLGVFIIAGIAAFIIHLFGLGDIYIEFDGRTYFVWQRAFLGFNHLRGYFNTEKEARAHIEKLKQNPPRTIRP